MEAKASEASLGFEKDVGIQEFILEGDSLIMYRDSELSSPPPPSFVALVVSSICLPFVGTFVGLDFLMYIGKVIDQTSPFISKTCFRH